MDIRSFQQPDNKLRPAPFWAINDRITPEETARQMADMLRVGLSGGFFHSRAGLTTDYLRDDWFAAMNAALDVAREQDGYLWLYDEDLWPSGNAGGQVAGMKDDYRAASLRPYLLKPGEGAPEIPDSAPRAAYLLQRDGVNLESAVLVSYDEALAREDAERLIFYRVYQPKQAWWGGESYANLLHPEGMQRFIEMTHEVYWQQLGDEFGRRVPAIFTDEPNINPHTRAAIPWYDGLPDLYREWHGRDFWADLPALCFETAECRYIRLSMHRTILRQFCEAFTKPIYEWCEAHHIAHTGHFLLEDTLAGQIASNGGGVMAQYRYQQIPGIDHLCRRTTQMLLTAKQVGSAARQLGRKHVLTEIFGVSRHTNTFEDFKWIGDFNMVLGADFFCPHLTLYSARGRRKRDYPPNWNYQQTYWNELRPLNDYFARVAYAVTSGVAQADAVVLHPIETAMSVRRYGVTGNDPRLTDDDSAVNAFDTQFRRTVHALLTAGYDCDLGDESYFDDLAAVEGNRFRIGEMSYPVVIVPPALTWRPKTLELLQQFVANGGKLIFVGALPTEVECAPSEAWKALATQAAIVPASTVQIQQAMDRIAVSTHRLRDAQGRAVPDTFLQHRVDGDQEIFFIVNDDRERTHDYVMTLANTGKPVTIWNPLDGTMEAAPAQVVGDTLRVPFTLPSAGSLLLVVGADLPANAGTYTPLPDLSTATVLPLSDRWHFTRSEDNVLVMDRISASLDGGATWWPEDMEFRVRQQLARHFGTEATLQWQPWVAIRKGIFDGKGGEVLLRYRFHSALDHPTHVSLVIEDLKKGTVTVNGTPVDLTGASWHWDHDYGKVDITDLVVSGENVVDFRVQYNFLTEVETAYLVGDFGVRLRNPYEGELIEEPKLLTNGPWLTQGYPFYSGAMTYQGQFTLPKTDGRAFLRLQSASGILYKVRVNDREAGSILWSPNIIELTDLLHAGENRVEIDVISSRQNSLGPLHEKDGDDNSWVGPYAFEGEWCVREEFSLFEYGLLDGAEIAFV